MNFLEKAKAQTQGNVPTPPGSKMPKPPAINGIKPPTTGVKPPTSKPPVATKPQVTPPTIKPVEKKETVDTPLMEKSNVFLNKAGVIPETKTQENQENTNDQSTAVKETSPATVTDMQPTEEIPQVTTTEIKEKTSTETIEETKPKKRKSKKAKTVQSEETEITELNIPTSTCSLSNAIKAISSPFVDEEWEQQKQEILQRISEIVITNDMNTAEIKNNLALLDDIRTSIFPLAIQWSVEYDKLADKTNGIIARIKASSNIKGSSEAERKDKAIRLAMEYKTPEGENLNLYELLDEYNARKTFLDGVMKTIEYKKFTINSIENSLKLEK